MDMKKTINLKLTAQFSPRFLEIIDESEKHRGHAGYREGGNSHFRVRIAADTLDGQSRVQQHRAINECLSEELKEAIHALAIEVVKPEAESA